MKICLGFGSSIHFLSKGLKGVSRNYWVVNYGERERESAFKKLMLWCGFFSFFFKEILFIRHIFLMKEWEYWKSQSSPIFVGMSTIQKKWFQKNPKIFSAGPAGSKCRNAGNLPFDTNAVVFLQKTWKHINLVEGTCIKNETAIVQAYYTFHCWS